MPTKTIPMRLRLAPSVLEALKVQAEAHKRTVAGLAAVVIEEWLSAQSIAARVVTTATSTKGPAAPPGMQASSGAAGRHTDQIMEVVRLVLADKGVDIAGPDGSFKRAAQIEHIRTAFYATKPHSTYEANKQTFSRAWKRLQADKMVTVDGHLVFLG